MINECAKSRLNASVGTALEMAEFDYAKKGATCVAYKRANNMSTHTESQHLAFEGYRTWHNANEIPVANSVRTSN